MFRKEAHSSMTPSKAHRSPIPDVVLRHRAFFSFAGHMLLFAAAFAAAFCFYFNFKDPWRWFRPFFLPMLAMILPIKMVVFMRMNLLQRGWRYFGMRDLRSVIIATWICSALFVVSVFALQWIMALQGRDLFRSTAWSPIESKIVPVQFPQSVFILDFGLTIAAICGSRILVRLHHEQSRPVATEGATRCLIIGAGDTGEALLRELLRMDVERYRVVGFLDDEPSKQKTAIHDVPVLGGLGDLRAVCESHQIHEILIAQPRMPQKQLRELVEAVEGMNVRFQMIPAMEEVIAGRVAVSQIRNVDINDLLGREQVRLDEAGIREFLCGKRVLITGAGGSIGSEVCRQVARYRPAMLIMVEQAENNLFEIDRELGNAAPSVSRICRVADICDARRMETIFTVDRPEVVFHAAAHKHVPMMESNPGEAVKNNVGGTRIVADAAKRHGVGRFVMISTDKAVNPTSVMGCTKRVAEMYIQQLRQGAVTQFMTVRFGNVLGSSGSVVPIFARQIAAGGPVTVTHPEMTRYFMTIPEATQLVLQAGVLGADGDIFLLDMGEPVKILDLAREMITLSGLRPGEDIEIQFTGTRPGEKLFEELSVRGEDMAPTPHDKIYIWRNRKEDWPRAVRLIDKLLGEVDTLTSNAVRDRLGEIVQEYDPREAMPPEVADELVAARQPEPVGSLTMAPSRDAPAR